MPLISNLTAHLKQFALTNPSFTAQLNELWRKLETTSYFGCLPDPLQPRVDTTYTGDGPAVSEFVAWFRNVVANEKNTPKTDDRGRAFDVLEQDILGNHNRPAFPEIDRYKFAFQLALRIREPKLINQTNTNLCGPNSLVIQMARDRPSQYARLAADLFLRGSGTIDALRVEPDSAIRHGFNESALDECDYVVLGSVRNSLPILFGDGVIRTIGLLTKPGVLCDWLRRAGYERVEDHTFFDVPWYVRPVDWMTSGKIHGRRPTGFTVPTNEQAKVDKLKLMAAKLNLQHKVIMNAEGTLSKNMVDRNNVTNSHLGAGLSNALTTHWTYVKKLELSDTHVTRIKLYSWGGSIEKTNIPIDNFVSRYAGFVSYRV